MADPPTPTLRPLKRAARRAGLASVQRRICRSPKGWLALGVIPLLLLWQARFLSPENLAPELASWRLLAASGAEGDHRFLYFLYHLGLYPVGSRELPPDLPEELDSPEAAEQFVRDHGKTLVMDLEHAVRMGENLQAYLCLPGAYLSGSAQRPTMRAAGVIGLWLGLALLVVGGWRIRRPILGALLAVLIGSHPFLVFEVYENTRNVFEWFLICATILLGLNLRLLDGQRPAGKLEPWVVAALSGVIVGTGVHVRPALLLLVGGPLLVAFFLPKRRWIERLGLCALILIMTFGVRAAWHAHFAAKYREAATFVEDAGGYPFRGEHMTFHAFWHPFFCGLGDYGQDKGYVWGDDVAYRYAEPILEERYGVAVPERRAVILLEYWDEAQVYYKKPENLPHYSDVLFDKLKQDVGGDPLWYLGILFQRVKRVFTENAPPQLNVYPVWLKMPISVALLLGLLTAGGLVWWRDWQGLKLVGFVLPTALPAVLVYSGGGMVGFAIVLHVLVAIALTFGLELLAGKVIAERRALKRGEAAPEQPSAPADPEAPAEAEPPAEPEASAEPAESDSDSEGGSHD